MVSAGLLPDTISSDIHAHVTFAECNLPTVLSKFLALGLTIDEVISRASLAPARILGLDKLGIGTLRPGSPGDLVVFRVVDGPVVFNDTFGHSFSGHQRLEVQLTIQQGVVVYDHRDQLGLRPRARRVASSAFGKERDRRRSWRAGSRPCPWSLSGRPRAVPGDVHVVRSRRRRSQRSRRVVCTNRSPRPTASHAGCQLGRRRAQPAERACNSITRRSRDRGDARRWEHRVTGFEQRNQPA